MRGGDVVHALVERNNVGKIVVNADDDFIILILACWLTVQCSLNTRVRDGYHVLSCIMYFFVSHDEFYKRMCGAW